MFVYLSGGGIETGSSHLPVHCPHACSSLGQDQSRSSVRVVGSQLLEPSAAASYGLHWQEAGTRGQSQESSLSAPVSFFYDILAVRAKNPYVIAS